MKKTLKRFYRILLSVCLLCLSITIFFTNISRLFCFCAIATTMQSSSPPPPSSSVFNPTNTQQCSTDRNCYNCRTQSTTNPCITCLRLPRCIRCSRRLPSNAFDAESNICQVGIYVQNPLFPGIFSAYHYTINRLIDLNMLYCFFLQNCVRKRRLRSRTALSVVREVDLSTSQHNTDIADYLLHNESEIQAIANESVAEYR